MPTSFRQGPAAPLAVDSTATTAVLAFGSSVAAGTLLAAAVSIDTTATTTVTVTDSINGSGVHWQQDALLNSATDGQLIGIYSQPSGGAGACTVTATFGASSVGRRLSIVEISGADLTSSRVDKSSTNRGNNSGTNGVTSLAQTTTGAGVFVYGACERFANRTMAAGTGFTLIDHSTVAGGGTSNGDGEWSTEYQVQTSAGSVAATWTPSGATTYIAAMVAYKAASAGTSAAGTAALTLTASGAGKTPAASVAALSLAAAGAAVNSAPSGTAALATAAAGTVKARATATATLTLTAAGTAAGVLPLITSVSSDGRYFLDQNGDPILVHGDSAWPMLSNIDAAGAATYFDNRATNGFNLAIVELVNYVESGGPNNNGNTAGGVSPWVGGDIGTFNEAYWAVADAVVASAAANGITLYLLPVDNQNLALGALNGTTDTELTAYGAAVATRYADADNIIWGFGNDYQNYPDVDTKIQAVLDGLNSVSPARMFSLELNYWKSNTFDDAAWEGADFCSTYTYEPTYKAVLDAYNHTWSSAPTKRPTIMLEANYELQSIDTTGVTTTNETLRRQWIWTMTSGGAGHVFGKFKVWDFESGWEDLLDSDATTQLHNLKTLWESLAWTDLVPDQANALVTAGRGTKLTDDEHINVLDNDYVTAAATPDGTLAFVYMPTGSPDTITVDMSKLGGSPAATWVDPSDTSATTPATVGSTYTRPGTNADGNSDWLLLLQATGGQPTAGTAALTLASSGTASKPTGGAAALTLTASGTGGAPIAGAASLSLTATGTAQTPAAGSAALTLTTAGTGSLPSGGTATIGLTAGGTAQAPTGGGASLSLTATGATAAATGGTAALTVTATGTASLPAASTATLDLAANGTTKAPATATATITLAAAGSAAAPVIGTATLTLAAAGIIGNNIAGTATLDLTATGTSGTVRTRNITITISLISGGWSVAPASGSWTSTAAPISGWGTDTPSGGWAADSITA